MVWKVMLSQIWSHESTEIFQQLIGLSDVCYHEVELFSWFLQSFEYPAVYRISETLYSLYKNNSYLFPNQVLPSFTLLFNIFNSAIDWILLTTVLGVTNETQKYKKQNTTTEQSRTRILLI